MIQTNPLLANTALQDPRMITVMGVLMGIDMQGFSGDDLPPNVAAQANQPSPTPVSNPTPTPTSQSSSSSSKPKEPEDVKMADPEPAEDDEEAKAKKEAEIEKQKGSEAYKKHDFETAAAAFQKAWDVWPKDITFLTNLSGWFILPRLIFTEVVRSLIWFLLHVAVYLEQGEYDKSIETSHKAIEEGRSVSAQLDKR